MNDLENISGDLLAAEYALGVMDGPARKKYRRDLLKNANMQKDVVIWEERFAPLAIALPEVKPSEHVLNSILLQIKPEQPRARKNKFWRGFGISAAAFAVVFMIIFLLPHKDHEKPEQAQYSAMLKDSTETPAWMISVMAEGKKIAIQTIKSNPIGETKSYELWMLPSDKSAPVSLGLVSDSGETNIHLDEIKQRVLLQSSALAISLEPKGGSPTGAPTGPVLFSGPLVKL